MEQEIADATLLKPVQTKWLSFVDESIEQVYQSLIGEELRGVLRSGLYQSFFSWGLVLVIVYFIIPEHFLNILTAVLVFLYIPFGVMLWSTFRVNFKGYFQRLAAISNVQAGLMTIYVCHHFSNGVNIMMMVLIMVIFFGSYLYRFQFLLGGLVTFIYIAGFQLYLLSIDLALSQLLLLSSIAWTSQIFSFSLGFVYEKNQRNQFILNRTIRYQKAIIEEERKKSDELLLNILPQNTAEELKASGKSEPKLFKSATLLLSDFQGFTPLVSSIPATQLIEELNDIYSRFDDIMDEVGIEKVKTIGDAYLAVSGLPTETEDHAKRCIVAAIKMLQFLEERNKYRGIQWKMRVGIHSGPIVAGVVGKKKFAYDLFGDTINTVSRIETAGEAGSINISAATYELIKDEFACIPRGEMQVKGKGRMHMYFVKL
jgi:class 3 adenylate cyclase